MAAEAAPFENNRIVLRGVFAGEAALRTLPSGDELVSFRITVVRPPGDRVKVDSIECAGMKPVVRRAALRCRPGDLVEVSGSLRRRFWRSAAGTAASRYEVEVDLLRRERPQLN